MVPYYDYGVDLQMDTEIIMDLYTKAGYVMELQSFR